MPLESFGSILSFAAQVEGGDRAFYEAAAANPACAGVRATLEGLAADAKKGEQAMLRTRRENVTEMILEPITGFTRAPFAVEAPAPEALSAGEVLAVAERLEERAERFYAAAADKIKALPEVARALRRMGRTRAAHRQALARLAP